MEAGTQDAKGMAARGAATLSVRQILVGVVTVAGVVVLPLLLTPAEFSLYGYVNTVVLVGAAIGDLGLGAYIIKNRVSDSDLRGSLAIQLAFWIPACAVAGVAAALLHPFGFSTLTSSLLLVSLLLLALQSLPTALLEKTMAFGPISAIEVGQRVILVGVAIALSALNPSEWSIPLAAAAAAMIGYPLMMRAASWRWAPRFASEPLFRGFSSQWWQVRIANQATYATYPLLGGLLFSAHDVGLIVWALAITSIPAYLAPMVARATYPALARAEPDQRATIFSALLRSLLVIGAPMIAGLLVAAGPLTSLVFSDAWTEGVPLLRLESVTTFIGIPLSLIVPLMFLTTDPVRVKWMSVAATAAVIVLSIALSTVISFKAISVATIVCSGALLISFARLVLRRTGYNPLRDLLPAGLGVLAGVAVGVPLAALTDSDVLGVAAGVLAGLIQLAVTFGLKGGIDVRTAVGQIRGIPAAEPE